MIRSAAWLLLALLAGAECTVRVAEPFAPFAPWAALTRSDPELVYRLRPGANTWFAGRPVAIDGHGFRAEPSPSAERGDPPDLSVLVLGDSRVFGAGVNAADAFPEQLRQGFKRAGLRVEVSNAGVPGYSSAQGLVYLDRLLERQTADWVVIAFGDADRSFSTTPDSVEVFGSAHHRPYEILGVRTVLFAILNELLSARAARIPAVLEVALRSSPTQVTSRVALPDFETNLFRMVERVRGRDGEVAILLLGESPLRAGPLADVEHAWRRGDRRTCAAIAEGEIRRRPESPFRLYQLRRACRGAPSRGLDPRETTEWRPAMSRPETWLARPLDAYERTAAFVCDLAEVPCIDVRRELGRHPEWFLDQVHLTRDGHAIVADALLRLIEGGIKGTGGAAGGA